MSKFENLSVSVRHVLQAAFVLVTIATAVAIWGSRLTALEDKISGYGGIAEIVRNLTLEQAVMNTKLDNMEDRRVEDKEDILRALERIERKVDTR